MGFADAASGPGTRPAGEEGAAAAAPTTAVEVIVGEIPLPDDPTSLVWTARCSDPGHDLLGHFETRHEAERMRSDHLKSAHGRTTQ
jgi:hypothetical protein